MIPSDLPPISNRPLYIYRVFVKWLSFFVFGLGTLILVTLFFPPMRLFLHPKEKFKKYGRRLVSFTFGGFVSFMHILRGLDLEAENREVYRNLSSKIITANHPSILDIVILLSLIPNADCIVNAELSHNIVRGVVRQLYILNSLDFDDLLRACNESLNQGNCLIIFPEGTRTPRSGNITLKRGAARIALVSGCGVIPVHIGGTDKYKKKKKDPWTGFNPRDRYVYRMEIQNEIDPGQYRNLSMPRAVRALTKDLSNVLFKTN
jgi:1-acyl-sn-glycerol-3-phosphate acyltransferase